VKKFILSFFLLGATLAFGQVSIGIRIGPPPPPRVIRVHPVAPGPEFIWIDGYWYASGRRWKWHDGYWTRPPFPGAHWIAPRHENGLFYEGYWDGDRGRFPHDHRWDHDRDRDHHWERDHH